MIRWLALGLAIAAPSDSGIPPLEAELVPTKTIYRGGEPITARVILSNPAESKERWYATPHLLPVPATFPSDYDTAVFIQVWGPDGRQLEQKPVTVLFLRLRGHPSMFVTLAPGAFFGRQVTLNGDEFGFNMDRPGSYRVVADVRSRARHWYDAWLAEGHKPQEAHFRREQLFEGSVWTKAVQIRVE